MPNPSPDRSAWFNVSGSLDPSIRVATADMVSRTVVTVNVGEMLHVQLSPEVAGDLYRALGDVLAEMKGVQSPHSLAEGVADRDVLVGAGVNAGPAVEAVAV